MMLRLAAWEGFKSPSFWWLDLMVAFWALFALMLFVVEPLWTDRLLRLYVLRDKNRAFSVMTKLHWLALGGRRSQLQPRPWARTGTCRIARVEPTNACDPAPETVSRSGPPLIWISAILLFWSLLQRSGRWLVAALVGRRDRRWKARSPFRRYPRPETGTPTRCCSATFPPCSRASSSPQLAGRIVPSFTRNWLVRENPGRLPIPFGKFDGVAISISTAELCLWVAAPSGMTTAAALFTAGILQLVRIARWAGERTVREPLVLILHVAYAFVPAGFILTSLAALSDAQPSAGFHGWMAGGVGIMTLAVMTRATLGHTGRQLAATPGTQVIFVALCSPH
jgi:hypothetical protein